MAQGLLAPAKLQAFGLRNYTPSATAQLLDDAVERDALAESTSAKRCVGETGKSMKAGELAGPQEDSCRKSQELSLIHI